MQEQTVAQPLPGTNDRAALVRKADLITAQVLRGGVLLSASIIVIGVVMFYARYFRYGAQANLFPHSFGSVMTGIAHGDASSVIVLGLLVLLATPVLRVAVSIVAFALERDWRYVIITSIVLLVLLLSFFLGRGGA